MARLNPKQRTLLSEKLADMANLVAAALVIGFFLGEPRASGQLLAAAVIIWSVLLLVSLGLSVEKP